MDVRKLAGKTRDRPPGAPPAFGQPVLPPISTAQMEYQTRQGYIYRQQGRTNPSYVSHEDFPPSYTRRELPKAPVTMSNASSLQKGVRASPATILRSGNNIGGNLTAFNRYEPGSRRDRGEEALPPADRSHGHASRRYDDDSSRAPAPDVYFLPLRESPSGSSSDASAPRSAVAETSLLSLPAGGGRRSPMYDHTDRRAYDEAGGFPAVSRPGRPLENSTAFQRAHRNAHILMGRHSDGSNASGNGNGQTPQTNLIPQKDLDLHIVFDIFTQNPLTVPSSPVSNEFVESDDKCNGPYWSLIRTYQQSELFLDGILLRSVTPEAQFPYIHYIVFKNHKDRARKPSRDYTGSPEDDEVFYLDKQGRGCSPTPKYSTDRQSCSSSDNLELIGVIKSQGGYRETHSFHDKTMPVLPKRPGNDTTAYLISAFKTLESQDTRKLDETWSTWSGADYIVENIPKVLDLRRVTFHKVKYNNGCATFRYILLCELGNAAAKISRALSFVELVKLRQCGYTNLYLVEHEF